MGDQRSHIPQQEPWQPHSNPELLRSQLEAGDDVSIGQLMQYLGEFGADNTASTVAMAGAFALTFLYS